MAFKLASMYAFSHAYKSADPVVLEPIMAVEVTVPVEFQGAPTPFDHRHCNERHPLRTVYSRGGEAGEWAQRG